MATPEEARLRVWFADAGTVPCGGRMAAGCGGFMTPDDAEPTPENVTGVAYFALRAPGSPTGPQGRYIPYAMVRDVAAHEIGHALGLRHTDDATDIMYRHVTSNGFADAPGDTWLQRNPAALLVLVLLIGLMPFVAWRAWRAGSRLLGEWRERRAIAMGRRDRAP